MSDLSLSKSGANGLGFFGIVIPAFRYILYLSRFKNLTGIKIPLQSGLDNKQMVSKLVVFKT